MGAAAVMRAVPDRDEGTAEFHPSPPPRFNGSKEDVTVTTTTLSPSSDVASSVLSKNVNLDDRNPEPEPPRWRSFAAWKVDAIEERDGVEEETATTPPHPRPRGANAST